MLLLKKNKETKIIKKDFSSHLYSIIMIILFGMEPIQQRVKDYILDI